MTRFCNRSFRSIITAAALLLTATVSTYGQTPAVPCSAFARDGVGGWTVLAPVMVDIDGRLLGPMVGTHLTAWSTINGVRLGAVLDNQCVK